MQNIMIIFAAKYLIFLMIAFAALMFIFLPRVKKIETAFFAAIVLPLSYLLAKTFSFFFYNPRPFVIEKINPLIAHAADNGFPSDHTLLASAISATVFFFNKKAGIILWILTLMVGISRILAKVHHPIDIFGSLAIVVLISFVTAKFFLPAIKRKK